jgi:hypothetical protein
MISGMADVDPAPETARPSAHLDQLWRQTRAHHVQLSMQADQKANMLITVSTLMITLAVGLSGDSANRLATVVLVVSGTLSVLLAAYATMPRLRPARPTSTDPADPAWNPLFFGDFTRLKPDQFATVARQINADTDLAYHLMAREVYQLGQYLHRHKFRYLRLAYLVFITGLVLAAGLWVLAKYEIIGAGPNLPEVPQVTTTTRPA